MIDPQAFLRELQRLEFSLFTGTPCSYLAPLINTLLTTPGVDYVAAANEGDALAVGCGAELGGQPGVVLFQNSGLGNAVNPLTSLAIPLRIPVLIITSWRGQPGGKPDEPQHEFMGKITPDLLRLFGVPFEEVPRQQQDIAPLLLRARKYLQSEGLPFALIAHDTSFHAAPAPAGTAVRTAVVSAPPPPPAPAMERLDQDDVLKTIQSGVGPTDVVLATTGYTGRALYAMDDRPNQFYMVGSMGCVSSLGLGLARVQAGRRVVVIDGDGAMLMRMGAVATIGHYEPPNLVHILLDNAAHDSTGGQSTVSDTVDLARIAWACAYKKVLRATRLDELHAALRLNVDGPLFIHVRTKVRANRKLPRPEMTAMEMAARFRNWIKETS